MRMKISRHSSDGHLGEKGPASVQIRDEFWSKPPNVHCTSQIGEGRVTLIHS